MIPTPSSSRPWWSRSSVLSKSSSNLNRLSGSKKFNSIAAAIGLKPKKNPTPVEEPVSPVLPLHTADVESPRSTKSVVKPVSVAVGWADPRAIQPDDFIEAFPQSVFSTDLDPFAAAAKYPHGPPNVSDSLRFSTFSDLSTLESPVRKDAPHAHNRTSFTSSSSLSHQRSDITSDFSPISSPLVSPVTSGRHLSRLTVESERMLMRDNNFPSSPVSPKSLGGSWDDRSCIATSASPSSVTLTDVHGNGSTAPRPRTRSRGCIDTGSSRTDPLVSDHKVSSALLNNAPSPRVVIRQPSSSSSKLQFLPPQTSPPSSELPPAPDDVQQLDCSLLPAFVEHTSPSATSSSSSLSFASSFSSKLDTSEAEGRRRDVRRLKDAKPSGKSRPSSPSADTTLDIHASTSKPSNNRREFSPTRSLKKAISIQNMPKRTVGNSTPLSLPSAEDTKSVKKQRSFHHHTLFPVPPLPVSLKQTSSSTSPSGRDALSVPEDINQLSQKSPLSSPVLSPTSVRKRLFSGTSLRRSTSSQTPEPDDDTPSILSLPPVTSTLTRPHTAIPIHQSLVSNKPELSSFWDDETPNNPGAGGESRDLGPQHILSAADILKFENMMRDGENLNGFVRSRENSITSLTASKQSVRTLHEEPTSVRSLLSPPSAARQFDSLGTASSKFLTPGRQRARGNSLQGKTGNVTDGGRPQTGVTSLGQSIRTMSIQSLNAVSGLPPPPRQRLRPSTSSGASCQTIEDVPLPTAGDRSSVVALTPLSPPPVRRSVTRRTLDPPLATPILRPGISRTPSFLDMRDDVDREVPPPEDSFLDMSKVSLDTVRSSMEEGPVLS